MRYPLLLASLVLTASACTHHHTIPRGLPLPPTETNHLLGAVQGAGAGLLAGAAVGGVLGYAEGDDPPCGPEDWICLGFTANEKAAIAGVMGAGYGAIGGLLLGAAIGTTDAYEYEDSLVPHISATIAPGQASATAAWKF